jgi:hypothetical protein
VARLVVGVTRVVGGLHGRRSRVRAGVGRHGPG